MKRIFVIGLSLLALNVCMPSLSMENDESGQKEASNVQQGQEKTERCIICYEEDQKEKKQLCCGHRFHPECINSWFESNNTCPTCRKKFCVVCEKSLGEGDEKISCASGKHTFHKGCFSGKCQLCPQLKRIKSDNGRFSATFLEESSSIQINVFNDDSRITNSFYITGTCSVNLRQYPFADWKILRNRFLIVRYQRTTNCDIVDLQKKRLYTRQLQQKKVKEFHVFANRFFVVRYKADGEGIKKCQIFDLLHRREFIKQTRVEKRVATVCVLANRFFVIRYAFDGVSKDFDIFDLQENRHYFKQLKQKSIENWGFRANRFFIVRYVADESDKKECAIFDLRENQQCIEPSREPARTVCLQNKTIERYNILEDRFLVVRYAFDGTRKECEIFDLQENKQWIQSRLPERTVSLQNKKVECLCVRANRFLIVDYKADGEERRGCEIFDLQEKYCMRPESDFTFLSWRFVRNRLLIIEYACIKTKKIVCDIFDLRKNKTHIRQLGPNEICSSWKFIQNRFLIAEYMSEGGRGCHVFDLLQDRQYTKPLKAKGVPYFKMCQKRFLIVRYMADEGDRDECEIFDLKENRQCTGQILQKTVRWRVRGDRFLIAEYLLVEEAERECAIFDLEENRQYITRLPSEKMEKWDILANRFFIVEHKYMDESESKRECILFDLQKGRRWTISLYEEEKEIECWDMVADRFLIIRYQSVRGCFIFDKDDSLCLSGFNYTKRFFVRLVQGDDRGECEIFDVDAKKYFTIPLQQKTVKHCEVLDNRFLVVEYAADGEGKKECDLTDLQGKIKRTVKLENKCIVSFAVKKEGWEVDALVSEGASDEGFFVVKYVSKDCNCLNLQTGKMFYFGPPVRVEVVPSDGTVVSDASSDRDDES